MIKKLKEFFGLNFYTSKIDLFLAELNQKYRKLSESQRAETEKYKRISNMRDTSVVDESKKHIWDKF